MSQTVETLFGALCRQFGHLLLIFFVSAIFLIFTLASLFVLDPKSTAYIVSAMNTVILGTFTLGSGVVLVKCWSVES